MATRTTDVLVIGGGLLGCVTAYHLARDGVETTLVERGELNREASGTNAGSLHFQILRQPDYSPERLAKLRATVEIHAEAARLWSTMEQELGADLGVWRRGGLLVAETDADFATLQRKVEVERSMGLETELLSTKEMLEVCPALSDKLKGADYCAVEGHANPLLVTPAFARCATAYGARIQLHEPVQAIERLDGRGFEVTTPNGKIHARRIVNAAGAWAGQIAKMVGINLPITGNVLHVNVTEPWRPTIAQLIQHVGRRLTLKQTVYGTFIIGGGWPARIDPATGGKVTLWESILGNTWVASETVPEVAQTQVIRTWGGVIPATPDRLPVIGESARMPGFFVMSIGAGFTLGPVFGRLMAELLRTGHTSIPIGAYAPDRYM